MINTCLQNMCDIYHYMRVTEEDKDYYYAPEPYNCITVEDVPIEEDMINLVKPLYSSSVQISERVVEPYQHIRIWTPDPKLMDNPVVSRIEDNVTQFYCVRLCPATDKLRQFVIGEGNVHSSADEFLNSLNIDGSHYISI